MATVHTRGARDGWLSTGMALALSIACACEANVESGLDEAEANAIIIALHEAQIGAHKEPDPAGDGAYRVVVANDDVGAALQRMHAEGLPRRATRGLAEAFAEGGLVPTATEERARYVAALSDELSTSLEALDGVLDARVHVALPDTRRIALDDEQPRPRASVLLRHRGSRPPFSEQAVQALVAGAVQEMRAEDVAVVGVAVPERERTAAQRMVSVGPLTVARSSSLLLKVIIGGALASNIILAGLLVWTWSRRRRLASMPPAESVERSAAE